MAALFVFCLAFPAAAAPKPYHLQLEAQPGAVFPYLAKFGRIQLDVYASGVRADTVWLNGFSANGDDTITIENPFARMYTSVPLSEISSLLQKLGTVGSIEQEAAPVKVVTSKGKVGGIAATRYRLMYGPSAWIDLWMTNTIPENAHFRRIINDLVSAISPETGKLSRSIAGTPVFVELNFRRFKKVPLVRLKKLSFKAENEKKDLAVGSFYIKAPFVDSLWK